MPRNNSESNRRWRERNPEKVKAHTTVDWAKKSGKLRRKPCEVCGIVLTHAHHDDYSKPLEVRWLCSEHHLDEHYGQNRPRGSKVYVKKAVTWPHRLKYQPAPKRDAMLALAKAMRAEGQTYPEIADALGISKGTVYKWINPKRYG